MPEETQTPRPETTSTPPPFRRTVLPALAGSDDSGGPPVQVSATQFLGNIPFEAIIGGPLVAAIRAQALAAGETLHYIMQLIHGSDSKSLQGGTKEILSVEFSFERSEQGQQPELVTLTVPLLVLVPIPFIDIDTMTITFKADINASTSFKQQTDQSWTHTTDSKGHAGGFLSFFGLGGSITGAYSSKSDSKATANSKYSVEYNMDVYVHATGEDMPAGTAKLLNVLTKSITESGGGST
jgi:hypothetical protein